jgi:hypothetical protein
MHPATCQIKKYKITLNFTPLEYGILLHNITYRLISVLCSWHKTKSHICLYRQFFIEWLNLEGIKKILPTGVYVKLTILTILESLFEANAMIILNGCIWSQSRHFCHFRNKRYTIVRASTVIVAIMILKYFQNWRKE